MAKKKKLDFLTIIAIMVRIWVLTIFLWTIRWIAFSWLNMYPYIPPVYFNVGVFRALMNAGAIFVAFTSAVVLMLWAIYFVVKLLAKKMPLPFKILKKILKKMPPFKQLIQTGLFGLFDSIFLAIIKRRPSIFVGGLIEFWRRNIIMLTSDLGRVSAKIQALDAQQAQKQQPQPKDPNAPPPSIFEEELDAPNEASAPEEPSDTANQRLIENRYQICLQQNLTPFDPADTSVELAKKKLDNRSATVRCQLEKATGTMQQSG